MDWNMIVFLTFAVVGAVFVVGGISAARLADGMRIRLLSTSAILIGIVVWSVILVGAFGNSNGDDFFDPSGEKRAEAENGLLVSDRQRVTDPDVKLSQLTALAEGNSEFAFDLYQEVRNEDGNLFFSPFSISQALAMTYAGARGATEREMASTLHFDLPQEQLHPAFNALDLKLTARGQGDDEVQLNIANAIWGQEGYLFLVPFLDVLAENYGSGLRIVDFTNALEDSRTKVNDWVSEQTEGKIKELFSEDALSASTRFVLTNAIYFNANWQYQFEPNLTEDGTFHLLDGDEVTVPMMRQVVTTSYTRGGDYQAVELPYDGDELSMVILLPDEGGFESFETDLDARTTASILADLSETEIDLSMPRFEFEAEFNLTGTLADMGMPSAMSEFADFSDMTGERDLHIGAVVHKAFIHVDETGTEAAAATGVSMFQSLKRTISFTINRPFIFLIRDVETGSILFVGRVMDPSA